MNGETIPHQNGAALGAPVVSPPARDGGSAGDRNAGSPTVLMVGESPAMLEVFDQIRRFAACDVPVLITGESGTGKELVARAIHHHSGRSAGPFIALNCAAVPATLIASELFGYEKGAFTGATARKHGHVEHAQGGTLFLDEIGDMPFDLQGLLLRFLQEGEILRVGGRRPIKIDARVVAATNVRLREAITAGKLREDLYYRLNVLTIRLPPLRERDGDIEILATCFLREIASEQGRQVHGFSPAAMDLLLNYGWPGNVRELIATIRRAVVLADRPLIGVADLRLEPEQTGRTEPPRSAPVRRRPNGTNLEPASHTERGAVVSALEANRFNMTRTARALGVSRATLYRMLHRNQIELDQQFLVRDSLPAAPEA